MQLLLGGASFVTASKSSLFGVLPFSASLRLDSRSHEVEARREIRRHAEAAVLGGYLKAKAVPTSPKKTSRLRQTTRAHEKNKR